MPEHAAKLSTLIAIPDLEAAPKVASEWRYRKRYRDYDWSLNEHSNTTTEQAAGDGG